MGGPKPGAIPLNKRNTMHLNCNNNAELEIADTALLQPDARPMAELSTAASEPSVRSKLLSSKDA